MLYIRSVIYLPGTLDLSEGSEGRGVKMPEKDDHGTVDEGASGGEAGNDKYAPLRSAVDQLRQRRLECRLSHAEAAALSAISTSTIKTMEGPTGRLTERTLQAVERGLGVKPRNGHHWGPGHPRAVLTPVLTPESVRSIADVIAPVVMAGDVEGERLLLEYRLLVDALSSEHPKPPKTLDYLRTWMFDKLPPEKVSAWHWDLSSRFGPLPNPSRAEPIVPIAESAPEAPALEGRLGDGIGGSRLSIGPTPRELGAILNSGLPDDVKEKLFSHVVARHGEVIAAVEEELYVLIETIKATQPDR